MAMPDESKTTDPRSSPDRLCERCDKPIPAARAARPKTKYCSWECADAAAKEHVEARLRQRYGSGLPNRRDLEALALDDLIAIAMDAHFALRSRGHAVVLSRLREKRDELQAEKVRTQSKLSVAQARITELKADLPRLIRRQHWLGGPGW